MKDNPSTLPKSYRGIKLDEVLILTKSKETSPGVQKQQDVEEESNEHKQDKRKKNRENKQVKKMRKQKERKIGQDEMENDEEDKQKKEEEKKNGWVLKRPFRTSISKNIPIVLSRLSEQYYVIKQQWETN